MQSFSYACHLCNFSGELSILVFGPFFNNMFVLLLLSFRSSVYILCNSPGSDVFFCKYLLPD